MIPGESFKKLIQGDPLEYEFVFEGVNLTGAVVEMLLRKPGGNSSFFRSSESGNLSTVFVQNATTVKWVLPKTLTENLIGQYDLRVKIDDYTWIKGTLEVTK